MGGAKGGQKDRIGWLGLVQNRYTSLKDHLPKKNARKVVKKGWKNTIIYEGILNAFFLKNNYERCWFMTETMVFNCA